MRLRAVIRLSVALATVACLCLTLAAGARAASAEQLMGNRPFAPTDRGLFQKSIYPGTAAEVPASGSRPTEGGARAALSAYLLDEFPGDASARAAALMVFDDPDAKTKIPSPQLRAAFAALRGTIGDAAIDYFLDGETALGNPVFTKIVECAPCGALSGAPALATPALPLLPIDPDDTQLTFNKTYEAEDPFLFSAVWLHEVLHAGGAVSPLFEEATASSLEQLFILHQLARHPELAQPGTQLTRRNNSLALARLNSGTGSALGLFASNGDKQIFPDSPSVAQTDLWSWLDGIVFAASPHLVSSAPQALADYLAATHVAGAPNCSPAQFSEALLDCIDLNGNSGLCSDELIAAAQALGLAIGGTPTTAGACNGSTTGGGGGPGGGPGGPNGGGGQPGADNPKLAKKCSKAKKKLKKLKRKLRKAKKKLKRARRADDAKRIAHAKKKKKRAKRKLRKAKRKRSKFCVSG